MNLYYTDEQNAQIVLAFLKKAGIRKIVASPGSTNIPILTSIQYDPFFEVYSSVDERSAAYMACGLAAESGEKVALSCTGATASRNYFSGLTEAYYRKLPIVAITSAYAQENIGNLVPQAIDRSSVPNDVVKLSVQLPVVQSQKDFWYCSHLVNKALLELDKDGGGPVHINLPTSYMGTFNTKELPHVDYVERLTMNDPLPNINVDSKIILFIGSHKKFLDAEIIAIEEFCERYNVVVLYDHTSNYKGKNRILGSLACSNATVNHSVYPELMPDLIIHIGEISGDYSTTGFLENCNAPVWRVSSDGELKDKFKKLKYIFYYDEFDFFRNLNSLKKDSLEGQNSYFQLWQNYSSKLRSKLVDLPFSNIWIASQLSSRIPNDSTIHFGILNSLRSNNFFEYDRTINTNSNVGGFGIDGCLSAVVGSSLANSKKLNFIVLGDLAFFYDMNVLGNRHIGKNLRILLVNNHCGIEFKNHSHMAAQFGERTDEFISAANHFRAVNSESSAESWVSSLGFEYLSARSTEEFEIGREIFFSSESERPIVFECFTSPELESMALKMAGSLDEELSFKGKLKNKVGSHISGDIKKSIKKVIGK